MSTTVLRARRSVYPIAGAKKEKEKEKPAVDREESDRKIYRSSSRPHRSAAS